MVKLPAPRPAQRRNSGQKLRQAREMVRRTSIQAALSRQNSGASNLGPPSFLSPASPSNANSDDYFNNHGLDESSLDEDMVPTDPNVWDEILQRRYQDDELDDLHVSSRGTATRSETDQSEELDNISLEALSDRLGNINISTYGLSADNLEDAEDIVEAVVEAHTLLEDEDIDDLSSFDLYVRHKPTEALFGELIRRYQPIDSPLGTRIPSIKRLRSRAPFIGYLAEMETCPICHEPRLDPTAKPRNIFTTIPLIPQLQSLLACPVTAEKMRYRHTYTNINDTMDDIFNSRRYLELRNLHVVIDGKPMPYKYFQEEHEVALGVTLDGACPFKRRTNTCWPIVVINYNLPSEERVRTENMICVGVIPGPQCPADINSFLQPLIDELRELARGVAAVDNLLPQIIDLWTGEFNDMGDGLENYQLDKDVWAALCDACVPSRRTIPTSFGCPVPDPRKRSQFIAETWSVFTTQLAPSLLHKRFSDQRYYQHFVRLVKLLGLVISFDLPRNKIPEIRQGFAEWVQEYEQIYYQFDEERLQTCPVNTHYLLHIADSIEYMGPIWCYWAYPMERFCSFVLNSVKSRRYPYANIDERVLNRARLQIILHKYRLIDKVPFTSRKQREESDGATIVRGYPLAFLLSPHSENLKVDRHLRRQIVRYLTTCFEVLSDAAEKLIPDELEQWGRLRIGNGGDEVHARGYHKLRADGRDAAFVRYQLMVDQDADNASAKPRFKEESQYGELRHIFVLTIPTKTPKVNPSRKKKRYLLLAQIYKAPVEIDETDEYKVVWYKGKLGTGEVVDVSTVQCALGRIKDGNMWWIVDRSADNTFAYPEFVD
ncbi:transposase family Tnp2 protein, partial [Rhizoctonia solani AG-3 Rhs1AP]